MYTRRERTATGLLAFILYTYIRRRLQRPVWWAVTSAWSLVQWDDAARYGRNSSWEPHTDRGTRVLWLRARGDVFAARSQWTRSARAPFTFRYHVVFRIITFIRSSVKRSPETWLAHKRLSLDSGEIRGRWLYKRRLLYLNSGAGYMLFFFRSFVAFKIIL